LVDRLFLILIKMKSIDINCDVGESFGHFKIGNDTEIFPYITSCNIACGFHGGDPYHIQKTIDLALKYGVQIGAHPSYPDRHGFGRREMSIPNDELLAVMKYQISALKGMVEASGAKMKYVKPHGALYNAAATKEPLAKLIFEAVLSIDSNLAVMGLAGSTMERIAQEKNIKFISEAFADRRYTSMSQLASRNEANAIINEPNQAASQVIGIVNNNTVEAIDGNAVKIQAESFCVHGDNPNAENILKTIRTMAENEGIKIKASQLT